MCTSMGVPTLGTAYCPASCSKESAASSRLDLTRYVLRIEPVGSQAVIACSFVIKVTALLLNPFKATV